jgi:hypothetical protein
MSALRSSAVWWNYRRGSFPRPLTIYAANVECVSRRGADSYFVFPIGPNPNCHS